MTCALCCSRFSGKVSSKPFTIIDGNLGWRSQSGLTSLVPGVDDLGHQMGGVVVAGRPVLQQALDELLQVELLLLVFPAGPELPEGPGAQGPEETGGSWWRMRAWRAVFSTPGRGQ